MAPTRNDPARAFLGTGWNFPIRVEADGQIALVSYEDDIDQAIRIILGTNPGERVMRPDFGAGLKAFVFEPVNTTTIEQLKTRVREALIDWEPRIDVELVAVTDSFAKPNELTIDIRYRVRSTNAVRNLVYPFYFEEGK
jgi:phage baseplate assembly protein W